MKGPFLRIAPSTDGRDLWMIGWGNTISRAWQMPGWLSFRSSRWFR